MDIWLVTIGEILPIEVKEKKQRTALLADTLWKKGHNILWWTSAFDHFKKKWLFRKDIILEINERYKIYALKGRGYKKNISLSRFIDHRIIAWKFKRLVPKMPKPDIIVASMPPHDLAYEAVMFAKENNVPTCVDIRDPWPDIFLEHIPNVLRGVAKMVFYKDFQMIKKVMRNAEGLISMMNILLQWGLNYANRDLTWRDRVFYLGYKKYKKTKNITSEKILQIKKFLKNKFVITFIGTFANYHNPSILVECAKRLREIDDLVFVLAGDGELFSSIKRNSVGLSNMLLPGWLNQEEINTILEYSHVGICPTPYVAEFFPNKIFVYLSEGLPVVSAFQGDLKEIIEKYQIGFYYPPNDVDALVDCIMKLYNNPDLYKRMSENAKRIFDKMFDADKIYDDYAEHIEKVVLKNQP